MVDIEIRLIIFFVAKDGEALNISILLYEEYNKAVNKLTFTYKMSDKQLLKNSIQANNSKGFIMVHKIERKDTITISIQAM